MEKNKIEIYAHTEFLLTIVQYHEFILLFTLSK